MTEGETVGSINAMTDEQATAWLEQLCSSPRWAAAVAQGRPYADAAALLAGSDAAFGALGAPDIDAALAGHPRIGDRVDGAGRSADLSRSEQSAMGTADDEVREQLRVGNLAYERRFDRVFLIRAAGRSPQEMLAELRRRLSLDDQAEAKEVREQLRQITRLRLEGAITP